MPIPCPCCKASNDAGPNCRRCKADLSLLFNVESERIAAVEAAQKLACESRFADALAQLDHAVWLRATPDVSRMRAAILLLARDFAGARRAYDAMSRNPTP